jgi:DNA-directed RNA polymerase specialized sigma24 family protein
MKGSRLKTKTWFNQVLATYGDMLFDLCQSMLWSPAEAPHAYRSILRTIQRAGSSVDSRFEKYERAWVFHIAYLELKKMAKKTPRSLTPAEQVMLDSNPDPKARLRHFDSYFHRLPIESQFLVILKDKYGMPMNEIASILEVPEPSLKLQRSQSLRLLESWIWSGTDGLL